MEKGVGKGRAESVLDVLEARGIGVPAEVRARILSCTNPQTLKGWLARALQVSTADELFVGLH